MFGQAESHNRKIMKSYPFIYILSAALLLITSMLVFSAGVYPDTLTLSEQRAAAQQFQTPRRRQVRTLSPAGGPKSSSKYDFDDWRRTRDQARTPDADQKIKITSGVSVKND